MVGLRQQHGTFRKEVRKDGLSELGGCVCVCVCVCVNFQKTPALARG